MGCMAEPLAYKKNANPAITTDSTDQASNLHLHSVATRVVVSINVVGTICATQRGSLMRPLLSCRGHGAVAMQSVSISSG